MVSINLLAYSAPLASQLTDVLLGFRFHKLVLYPRSLDIIMCHCWVCTISPCWSDVRGLQKEA